MPYYLDAGTPYYLDAGTGSMLVQLAVAGVAGAAVFAKMGWAKITSPFRRKRSADQVETERLDAQPPQHQRSDD
jgi:hypothetical protein